MALDLQHQTADQMLSRLRAAYQEATGERAAQIASLIADLLDAGDVTPAQMRSAWGHSQAEFAAMRQRAVALRDARRALKGARGE